MRREGDAPRDRCLLMVKDKEAFIAFCRSDGWNNLPPKGDDEVIRMSKENKLLIVHGRISTTAGNDPVHFTVWGHSAVMAKKFVRAKHEAQKANQQRSTA